MPRHNRLPELPEKSGGWIAMGAVAVLLILLAYGVIQEKLADKQLEIDILRAYASSMAEELFRIEKRDVPPLALETPGDYWPPRD